MNKKRIYLAAAGALVAALVGTAALSSASALEANGADGAYYLLGSNGSQLAAGATNQWTTVVYGNPTADATTGAVFVGSTDATGAQVFVSPRGSERTPSAWSAWSSSGFQNGTKNVELPSANLSTFLSGSPNGVKSAGGTFSLGVAFTKNNGLTIANAGVFYTYITVAAGGAWTFDTYVPPVAPGTVTGSPADVNLTATTLAAADGVLSLSVPAAAAATIGSPALVNGLSTSTGVLPNFTVTDARVVTHAGWTLTSSVTEFTNSADSTVKIPNTQLGIEPVIVSTTAGTGVVTVAAPTVAGSAVYSAPFAQATNGAAVGTTTFNANLKFVAPVGKPAGTYTSKLTLTLASK